MSKDFQPVCLEDVQSELVHSIKGLENAEMMRTGYAIEYDMVLPHQLRATLKPRKSPDFSPLVGPMEHQVTKRLQVKGLVAGINAALKIQGKPELDF